MNNINLTRLKRQISDLKAEGYYVIVYPHWGDRYCLTSANQARLARRIVNDCHADLILGHGTQVYGEISKIGYNWVVFSLGNLIFNSEGEYSEFGVMPCSLISELVVRFYPSGYRLVLNLYPIITCNQMTQFQPTFADAAQFGQVAEALRSRLYDPHDFDEHIAMKEEDGRHFFQIELI